MSPDGEAIVTGAGDETLRFWNVFSKMRSTKVLFPHISHLYLCQQADTIPLSVRNCLCLPPPCLLGICVSAEPLHQDPVVSTPLYDEGTKPGREFIFACVKL